MANGLNRVVLIGNLGSDPELRYTSGGQAVLKLRVATSETYNDKHGERKERVEWHTVVMWGKRAEGLDKILTKGRTVWAEGRLQTRSWEDKEGTKKYATEVNATDIGLVGSGAGQRSHGPDDDGGNEMF